jgi:hypothetical protein
MKPATILSNSFKLLGIFSVTAAFVLSMGLLCPEKATAAGAGEEKGIGIRDRQKTFKVDFEPTKKSYKAGEAIRFRIKGNRDFFLYLFSINREQNRAVLLIPGARQTGNKYSANQAHMVPNPGLEFFADRPGVEQVVMVASTKYIPLQTARYNKSGDFFTATPDVADDQIKALRLRPRDPQESQRITYDLTLQISGSSGAVPVPRPGVVGRPGGGNSPPPAQGQRPIVFLSSDRDVYRLGERVQVVFGADQPGWIYLYTHEPGGKTVFLKKEQISGKGLHRLNARAERPAGEHALVAVFGKQGSQGPKEKSVDDFLDRGESKGLRLETPETPPYAVLKFRIVPQ